MNPLGYSGNIRTRTVGHLSRAGPDVNNSGDMFMRCKCQTFGAETPGCARPNQKANWRPNRWPKLRSAAIGRQHRQNRFVRFVETCRRVSDWQRPRRPIARFQTAGLLCLHQPLLVRRPQPSCGPKRPGGAMRLAQEQ